ncbi:DUF485 domain-containing protein [Naumannella cuiyingiana]|uniref:Uncharacterized membrane protein (DUF485 family) n=1 Tax=Naumannella cuiyingiana TaxID=1347891 RepID=A0A7Z0D9D2_9ACTN|nr:DUF485 domain-containing protein [Naumannella cuiyingiana]NYI71384.1 uncharacterized membrane protein (DUF485 family) [Naumannella cuiyingiana]
MTDPAYEAESPREHQAYQRIAESAEFATLRKRYLSFVVPATVVFMAWYILYVICNNWARGFMNTPVIGHINVAVVWGLLQFVSTFAIAALYANYTKKKLDPLATELREGFEREVER